MDSSRSLAVKVISTFYGMVDRASRAVSMEREHIEDLVAEARAHYEASNPGGRPRTAASVSSTGTARVASKPTAVPAASVQDRAA